MFGTSIEKQWQRLRKQIDGHQDLLEGLKYAEADFRKFVNWGDVIDAFRQIDWNDHRSDAILRPIIQRLQQGCHLGCQDVLTAMLWHVLCSLYRRLGKSVGYKEEEPEDLWQDIHWQFLRCLYSIDLSPNEREIVFRLFFRVKDSIRDGIRKRKRDNLRRILSDPVDLDSIISPECILDASDISISARLSLYLRNGILKLIEYEIIKSFLGGSETLVECADRLGIDYETAKKIRQRAIKKIRHLDVFLSPFGTVAPPYIGGRRKYDRDSDDEDSY